ncbi:hypothetical protein Dimus_034301 [Dionaea muscipula]
MKQMDYSDSSTHIRLDDDKRWVIEIRNFFEEEEIDDGNDIVPVSIFYVPNTIKAMKPEAYSPQLIALGPYHQWCEELYKLEKYKLVSAKRVQARFKTTTLQLQRLIDKLMKMEPRIRGSYHDSFIHVNGETLAWVMAIDGIFLLDFLHTYTDQTTHSALASSPTLTRIVMGSTGNNKFASESILKDILMLENQIPLIVLKNIMFVVHCTPSETDQDLADNLLSLLLMDVCKEISPLKFNADNYPHAKVIQHWHLLDLLYHLIVPKQEQQQQQSTEELELEEILIKSAEERTPKPSTLSQEMEALHWIWKLLSKLNLHVVRKINLAIKIPIKLIKRISKELEQRPSDHLSPHGDGDLDHDHMKAPLVEEIMIPSVTELHDAGVEFCPTGGSGDITTIRFDAKARKFYLPVIHLCDHTEVVMRNLVAYEALALQGRPLVLARYTELMNGIIDTSEDAKLLREKNIIINRLKSDQEVADLWNGMSRAIRLSKVPHMDKAIAEANAYYNATPKRKFRNLMRKYVYGSWRILLFLATILLLVLMVVQSFCSVLSCPKLFNTNGSNADDEA